MNNLDQKVADSVHLIGRHLATLKSSQYFVGTSGGKDSGVILDMTLTAMRLISVPVEQLVIVHNPKPKDTHPLTLAHLYRLTAHRQVIFVPPAQMSTFIAQTGLLLEVDGTRRSEFDRADKSTNYISKGVSFSREHMPAYVEDGLFGLNLLYPIIEWSDADVFAYHRVYDLPLSAEYDLG